MLFEIFYLLFHNKPVYDNLLSLVSLKMVSKSALSAFENSCGTFFVNANTIKLVFGEFGSYRVFEDLIANDIKSYFELLSLLSTSLMTPFLTNRKYLRISNLQHVLRDPFYPDKVNLVPGRVLRLRRYLRTNPYLDSIINCPMKPIVTRIID